MFPLAASPAAVATPTPSSILGAAQHRSLSWSRRSGGRSRLTDDYEILRPLGRGAYGSVYLVRHKLDGNRYALKQIVLSSKNGNNQHNMVMREVEVLSRIHNEHIVRYYGAWVERRPRTARTSLPTTTNDSRSSVSSAGGAGDESFTFDEEESTGSSGNEDVGNTSPVCHLCQATYKDWEVSFEEWGLLDSVLQPLDLCAECYLKSLPTDYDKSHISIRETQPESENLFILMEYCGQTLREAVQDVNYADDESLWSLFLQCVKGLMYLHDNKIIHRDMKPTNIFVRNGVVKIGDLGLALQTSPDAWQWNKSTTISDDASRSIASSDLCDVLESNKSSQVGTYLYMAPEVVSGKYNERCDIFSLGVVLIEMFGRFRTLSERADILGKLRQNGIVPLTGNGSHRQQLAFDLAHRMTATNPADRPSAKDIWDEVGDRGELKAVESTIHCCTSLADFKTELESRECTIADLRRLLDEHGISHVHIR